jgi:integrase
MTARAIGYLRVSSTDQAQSGLGLEAQRAATVEIAGDFRAWFSRTGKKDATVNKALRVLRAAWNVAADRGYVPEKNPWRSVKPVRLPQRQIKFLSAKAAAEVLEKTRGDRLHGLVAVCLYAGLRASEAAALRWEDVNLREGFISVRCGEEFVTKSRRSRVVPIAPELGAILKPLLRGEGLCFPAPTYPRPDELAPAPRPYADGKLQDAVADLCRAVGVSFKLHDLRKTFATHLRARGVPIEVISAYLGHSSIAVTQGWYAGFALDETASYIDRLSFTEARPKWRQSGDNSKGLGGTGRVRKEDETRPQGAIPA